MCVLFLIELFNNLFFLGNKKCKLYGKKYFLFGIYNLMINIDLYLLKNIKKFKKCCILYLLYLNFMF